MTLPPRMRKATLAVHLTASIGWIGAAAAYLALAIAASRSADTQLVRAAWMAMELIGWAVLVPAAVGTVVTGVAISLGTRWGLLRHYWVVLSLTLTVGATVVLVLHMPDVSALQAQAQTATRVDLDAIGGDLFHSSMGLLILLGILVLNVYKPRGLTRYGWRRQQQQSACIVRG